MPETASLEMVEGGLYRNSCNAELRLIQLACVDDEIRRSFETLAPGLWVARQQTIFGRNRWLVTAEGMTLAGYARVTEEPTE